MKQEYRLKIFVENMEKQFKRFILGKKYGGIEASQLKDLKALQEENIRLKQMSDLGLDLSILKDVIEKKAIKLC